jgi:hypothetical protein
MWCSGLFFVQAMLSFYPKRRCVDYVAYCGLLFNNDSILAGTSQTKWPGHYELNHAINAQLLYLKPL